MTQHPPLSLSFPIISPQYFSKGKCPGNEVGLKGRGGSVLSVENYEGKR